MSTINLDSIPAPGATPITYNATSAKTFASDYFKLGPDGTNSSRDRKTVSILALIYELASLGGGTNYKSNHKGLIQDSQVYTGAISNFDMVTAMAAVDWTIGNAADATLSASLPALMLEGRDFAQLSDDQLDRILAFLNLKIRE